MEAKLEHSKSGASCGVDLIRISFSKSGSPPSRLANQILHEAVLMFDRDLYFSILPSPLVARTKVPEQVHEIEGIPFFRWINSPPEDWLDTIGGEEVLILLAKKDSCPTTTPSFKSGSLWELVRRWLQGDPYRPFKLIGSDGITFSVFYSSSHRDLEIYIPQKFKHAFFTILRKVGANDPSS